MIFEYCTESIEHAILAEKNGATRIEFCSNLEVGGITPEIEEVKELLTRVNIPVRVILRPTNSFLLTSADYTSIKNSISSFSLLDIDGFVFGYLNGDNTIDSQALKKIIQLAPSSKWTFHKAIDETPDIFAAIASLNLVPQIDTILSSGGQKTAIEGLNTLLKMQSITKKTVMPGGSITWKNLSSFMVTKSFQALHGRKIVEI